MRWRVAGKEEILYPPVVSGETVLWLSTEAGENGVGAGESPPRSYARADGRGDAGGCQPSASLRLG